MAESIRRPEIVASARRPGGFAFLTRRDVPGVLEVPPMQNVLLSLHTGGPTRVACNRGGKRFAGTAVPGDLDIIPRLTGARWEVQGDEDRSVLISLPQSLLQAAVGDSPGPRREVEVLNRFQTRDPVLEALAMAAAREIEDGCPSGGLYLDGLALAAASRVVACHSTLAAAAPGNGNALSGHRLRQVLSYVEDNLAEELSLDEIAAFAGLSPSHLTAVFRKATGMPVHQYVVRRRVERARSLLQQGRLSTAEVALSVGFAHQSHMARHMLRILGVRPRELRRSRPERKGMSARG